MQPFASNDELLLVALIANHDCVADWTIFKFKNGALSALPTLEQQSQNITRKSAIRLSSAEIDFGTKVGSEPTEDMVR
jgi:hypothetical protein